MSKQFYQFIGIFVCFLTFTGIYAQQAKGVPKICLGCICEAISGCNTTLGCNGEVCGPFAITRAYWDDAGKPMLNNEANTNEFAYPNCVNDAFCAGTTVERYMAKYGRDCNGDGIVDCDDYIRIHRYGKNGCLNQLESKFEYVYKTCMQTYG